MEFVNKKFSHYQEQKTLFIPMQHHLFFKYSKSVNCKYKIENFLIDTNYNF